MKCQIQQFKYMSTKNEMSNTAVQTHVYKTPDFLHVKSTLNWMNDLGIPLIWSCLFTLTN